MTTFHRLIHVGAIAGALAAVFLAGTADAQSPDSSGAYHACVNKKTGVLRLVDPGRRCRRNEKPITFNAKGQPGEPGRSGANGTNGTNGKDGSNGTNGSNGRDGTSIAARARSTGSLTLSSSSQTDPLTANTWTQQANALDVLFGRVMISNPTSCTAAPVTPGGPPSPGFVSGEIDVDGISVATFSSFGIGGGATPVATTISGALIFEPGTATDQVMTVKASDNCASGGHFVINSVAIDVAAMS